jgi:hypothetical protein
MQSLSHAVKNDVTGSNAGVSTFINLPLIGWKPLEEVAGHTRLPHLCATNRVSMGRPAVSSGLAR